MIELPVQEIVGLVGDPAPWFTFAKSKIGIHELPGFDKDDPFIVECLRDAGLPKELWHDETAWCGSFANKCMLAVGKTGPKHPAAARSWFGFGTRLAAPVHGCILVYSRPPDPSHGHVGFYDATAPAVMGFLQTLGGNEDNSVKVKPYPQERLLGCFWPPGCELPEGAVVWQA